jgi:hypothetical protein
MRAPSSKTEVPHIELTRDRPEPRGGVNWVQWIFLALLTAASAAAAYFLLPPRWWR